MGWVRCGGNGNGSSEMPVLKGTLPPSADLGDNGQIYLQYANATNSVNIQSSITNSSQGAYFDTGYIFKANSQIEMKCNIAGGANYPSPFGTRIDTTGLGSNQWYFSLYGTSVYYAMGGAEINTGGVFTYNTDAVIYAQANYVDIIQNGKSKIASTNAVSTVGTLPLYLFAVNLNSTPWSSTWATMTLYYCRIFEDRELVHYYLPALDPSNTPCLYDCVDQIYLYNQGSGTLTVGGSATVVPDIYATYCKVNGIWQNLISSNVDKVLCSNTVMPIPEVDLVGKLNYQLRAGGVWKYITADLSDVRLFRVYCEAQDRSYYFKPSDIIEYVEGGADNYTTLFKNVYDCNMSITSTGYRISINGSAYNVDVYFITEVEDVNYVETQIIERVNTANLNVTTSSQSAGTRAGWCAFNGVSPTNLREPENYTCWFAADGDNTPYIQYKFDQAYNLSRLVIDCFSNYSGAFSCNLSITGSLNGTDWFNITASGTSVPITAALQSITRITIPLDSSRLSKYIRITGDAPFKVDYYPSLFFDEIYVYGLFTSVSNVYSFDNTMTVDSTGYVTNNSVYGLSPINSVIVGGDNIGKDVIINTTKPWSITLAFYNTSFANGTKPLIGNRTSASYYITPSIEISSGGASIIGRCSTDGTSWTNNVTITSQLSVNTWYIVTLDWLNPTLTLTLKRADGTVIASQNTSMASAAKFTGVLGLGCIKQETQYIANAMKFDLSKCSIMSGGVKVWGGVNAPDDPDTQINNYTNSEYYPDGHLITDVTSFTKLYNTSVAYGSSGTKVATALGLANEATITTNMSAGWNSANSCYYEAENLIGAYAGYTFDQARKIQKVRIWLGRYSYQNKSLYATVQWLDSNNNWNDIVDLDVSTSIGYPVNVFTVDVNKRCYGIRWIHKHSPNKSDSNNMDFFGMTLYESTNPPEKVYTPTRLGFVEIPGSYSGFGNLFIPPDYTNVGKGTFTTGSSQYEKVEVDCGFKPDYVMVKMEFSSGYTYAMAIKESDTQYCSVWDLHPIENHTYIITMGSITGETGITDITDTGFKYRVNASNTFNKACTYHAVRF